MTLRRVFQIKITTIHFPILFIATYCKDFKNLQLKNKINSKEILISIPSRHLLAQS